MLRGKRKSKSKVKSGWQVSRLIKTNNKFSKAKVAIIAVSFAAIGAILLSTAFASASYTFPGTSLGYDSGTPIPCNSLVFGPGVCVNFDVAGNVIRGIDTVSGSTGGVAFPSPSGAKGHICIGASTYSGGTSYVDVGWGKPDVSLLDSRAEQVLRIGAPNTYCTGTITFPGGFYRIRAYVAGNSTNTTWIGWIKVEWLD